MALIKCEECNNEVSDKAVACPKCGAPVSVTAQDPTDLGRIRVVTTTEAHLEQDAELVRGFWGVIILVGAAAWISHLLFGSTGAWIGGILSFAFCLAKKSNRNLFLRGFIFKFVPLVIAIALIVWSVSRVFQ